MEKNLVGIEIKRLNLKSLKETTGNPQKMNDSTFGGIVESMKKKGWLLDPPVIWEKSENNYQIISGHHRIMAAIEAGILDTDCKVLSGLTEEQANLLVVEANKRRGDFDDELLSDFVNDLIYDHDYNYEDILEDTGLNIDEIVLYDNSYVETVDDKKESEFLIVSIKFKNIDRKMSFVNLLDLCCFHKAKNINDKFDDFLEVVLETEKAGKLLLQERKVGKK
jgi:ParB-like chromosome segregation protein Spo0J